MTQRAEPVPIFGKPFAKKLQGDLPRQFQILGLKNHTHSAVAEFFENSVMTNLRIDHQNGSGA